MKRVILVTLALALAVTLLALPAAAEENGINELDLTNISLDFDRHMARETRPLASIELYWLSERDPSQYGSNTPAEIFGRNSSSKLKDLPPFVKTAFVKTEADLLNYGIDNMGLRQLVNYYNKYTRFDIRFGARESISGNAAKNDVGLETKASVKFNNDFDSRIGFKFEPRSIDSWDHATNSYLFAENSVYGFKSELRYSSLDKLVLRISNANLVRGLTFESEYHESDRIFSLSATYNIYGDWNLKLWGEYPRREYDPHDPNSKEALIILYTYF